MPIIDTPLDFATSRAFKTFADLPLVLMPANIGDSAPNRPPLEWVKQRWIIKLKAVKAPEKMGDY
jgi:hypothetical protein